ncbi:hypothetical protein Lal_00040124 [Lupinus albus]|nr:hypothetical protein Lal_00040124 [Lupinus albus]
MGKISAKDKSRKIQKGRRKLRSTGNKYLKPGTISQLLYNQSPTSVSASSALVASGAAKACTDLGKKRVEVLNSRKSKGQCGSDVSHEDKVFDKTPLMLSPSNSVKPSGLLVSPKTPRVEHCYSDSRLESLPMDLMVKLSDGPMHDEASILLFGSGDDRYRSRLEMLSTMTPRPTERWPFLSKGDEKALKIRSPHTPKAPRHGPRPPSRLKVSELRQVAAVLFPESAFPTRCLMPSVIPKPTCKSLASNRVLFYEDELCQAVAQNKLL